LAPKRLAEQVESIAQGVAQRVIDLVVESLDMNALIARIDLNVVLGRVDLNEVVDRIDLNEVVDRVDMNKLLARVDINQIVSQIDVEALVKNTDLGAIIVSSSGSLATEAVDLGRSHAVSVDDTLARWVSRIRRNHRGRAEPPELPNTPEEP
jgi:UDP-N-acetylglucosamine 2-epimerase